MAKIRLSQPSINGGICSTEFPDTSKGEFYSSRGIDPDLGFNNSTVGGTYKTSNAISPTGYANFAAGNSGTMFTSYAIWTGSAIGLPYVFAVLADGKIFRYDSAMTAGSQTLVGTVTGNVANGAAIYNDYLYVTTGTDVSRYGPLSGVAALTNTVWTGATLGALTALTNTTYPSFDGAALPNHWMHVHEQDGQLYFLDYANGQGMVHVIRTTNAGVNDGSAYNVLDLPFNFKPVSICSYGTDLAIVGHVTNDADLRQGEARLLLWDTIEPSFYANIPVPDVYATALYNNGGVLYVFSGSGSAARVSYYSGGSQLKQFAFFADGICPMPGSVTSYGDRIYFGSRITNQGSGFFGVVYSYGSKNSDISSKLQVPICVPRQPQNNPRVTATYMVQQLSGEAPRLVVAWSSTGSGDTFGLSKLGFDMITNPAQFVTKWYIGERFKLKSLRLNFNDDISASRTASILVGTDDYTRSQTLSLTNGAMSFMWKAPEIKLQGSRELILSITFDGSSSAQITLPIEVEIETFGDQPRTITFGS